MSFLNKGNSLHVSGNELPSVSRRRRRVAYAMAVSEALKIQVNGSSNATKRLMNWTDASERTIKGWLSGTNGPCGEHLVELMEKSDEVWDRLRKMAKRPTIEARHLVGLRAGLEAAVAAINEILELPNLESGK